MKKLSIIFTNKSGLKVVKNILNICVLLLFINTISGQTSFNEIDILAKKCNEGQMASCNKLVSIAKNGKKEYDLRMAAFNKINDQSILEDIMKNDYYFSRYIVDQIRNINNKNILIVIANSSFQDYIRARAVEKITDQNTLISFAKNGIIPALRASAIKNINDQSILIEIFNNESESKVRVEAIKKISEQRFLVNIVNNIIDRDLRETALGNITDQNLLLSIASDNKESYSMRQIAINNLTDQNALFSFAENDQELSGLRITAIEKITDQVILGKILMNEYGYSNDLLLLALKNLNDQQILDNIAKNIRKSEILWNVLNLLNCDINYQTIIYLLNQNIERDHNIAAIAAIKAIPCDTILNQHYAILDLIADYKRGYDSYNVAFWRWIDYTVKIEMNARVLTYQYPGKRGKKEETLSMVKILHEGKIDMNEICELLLSPLRRNDLMKIAETSDIYYIRETAKRILEKNN
ncbi:MAG: hypothetical protein KKG99_00675 [Bacteroidetes bacterium]|nr:hypothetical protein [Bacteroidota bacterium]